MKRLYLIVLGVAAALLPAAALAHGGGLPRVTAQPVGDYLVYAWTSPENLTVNEQLHMTVGVTLAAADGNETPVTDATVEIVLQPPGAGSVVTLRAESGDTVGGVYYEADTALGLAGNWVATVQVTGAQGSGSVAFNFNVLDVAGPNWLVIGGAAAAASVGVGLLLWRLLRRQPGQETYEDARAAG